MSDYQIMHQPELVFNTPFIREYFDKRFNKRYTVHNGDDFLNIAVHINYFSCPPEFTFFGKNNDSFVRVSLKRVVGDECITIVSVEQHCGNAGDIDEVFNKFLQSIILIIQTRLETHKSDTDQTVFNEYKKRCSSITSYYNKFNVGRSTVSL